MRRNGDETAPAKGPLVRLAGEDDYARIGRVLVGEVAARLARQLGHHVPCSDLESIGNEALVGLIRGYNPAASPIEPYLRRFLRWAMLGALRGRRLDTPLARRGAKALNGCLWLGAANEAVEDEPAVAPTAESAWREALALRATACALAVLGAAGEGQPLADSTRSPDRVAIRENLGAFVRAEVADLEDSVARDVLIRHYFGDESFEDIAVALERSPTQICRLHRRALLVLDRAFRHRGLTGEPD